MLVAGVTAKAPTAFDEGEMTDRPKANILPDSHEEFDERPAVEGDAEGIGFQKPIHFPKGRFEPLRIIVTHNGLVLTVPSAFVFHKKWWIGDDDVDGCRRQLRHHFEAIAVK